jgi:hypothetical protein
VAVILAITLRPDITHDIGYHTDITHDRFNSAGVGTAGVGTAGVGFGNPSSIKAIRFQTEHETFLAETQATNSDHKLRPQTPHMNRTASVVQARNPWYGTSNIPSSRK